MLEINEQVFGSYSKIGKHARRRRRIKGMRRNTGENWRRRSRNRLRRKMEKEEGVEGEDGGG